MSMTFAAAAVARPARAARGSTSLLRTSLRVTSTPSYSCGPSSSSSSSSSSSPRQRRSIHSTPRTHRFSFLISHSFQGKPPDPEPSQPGRDDDDDDANRPRSSSSSSASASPSPTPTPPKQIGWPPSTPIGQWLTTLLGPDGSAGEDSLMVVRNDAYPGDVALGVADGVGSWSQNGVDPALFSQALMYHASQAFAAAEGGAADEGARPTKLLERAYRKVMSEKGVPAGSSTATVLTLEGETGVLRSANLGDSGFMVLRDEAKARPPYAGVVEEGDDLGRGRGVPGKRPLPGTLYRSSPQQWAFNAPNQLSKYPDSMLAEMRRNNGGRDPDFGDDSNPRTANEWSVRLQKGDIIVVASDGVWDNVWGKEWVGLVKYLTQRHREHFKKKEAEEAAQADKGEGETMEKWEEEKTLVEVIAYNALQYTLLCQFSEKKRSPFEAEAERYRIRFPGGKIDDISIVVAMVVEE